MPQIGHLCPRLLAKRIAVCYNCVRSIPTEVMLNSKKSNRIPPLRVALYVFCAGMFAVMAILTIIGRIYGLFHPSFAAMAANTLLWLFPFVSRWLLKDGIGDGMLTICAVFIFFAGFFET